MVGKDELIWNDRQFVKNKRLRTENLLAGQFG